MRKIFKLKSRKPCPTHSFQCGRSLSGGRRPMWDHRCSPLTWAGPTPRHWRFCLVLFKIQLLLKSQYYSVMSWSNHSEPVNYHMPRLMSLRTGPKGGVSKRHSIPRPAPGTASCHTWLLGQHVFTAQGQKHQAWACVFWRLNWSEKEGENAGLEENLIKSVRKSLGQKPQALDTLIK